MAALLDVNVLSPGLSAWDGLLTGRRITDAYLQALAVQNRGMFVTLDQDHPYRHPRCTHHRTQGVWRRTRVFL